MTGAALRPRVHGLLKLLNLALEVRDQFVAAVYLRIISRMLACASASWRSRSASVRSCRRTRPAGGEGDQAAIGSPDGDDIARLRRHGLAIGAHRRRLVQWL